MQEAALEVEKNLGNFALEEETDLFVLLCKIKDCSMNIKF